MKLTDVLLKRKSSEGRQEKVVESWAEEVQAIPVHLIVAGRYQPRQEFDELALENWRSPLKSTAYCSPLCCAERPSAMK